MLHTICTSQFRVTPFLPLFKLISSLFSSYILYAPAAYVWDAYIWLAPLVWIRGWDSYLAGQLSSQCFKTVHGSQPVCFQIVQTLMFDLLYRQGRAVLAPVLLLYSGGGGWARD